MERPFRQTEFQSQNIRNLGQLVDCRVRPAAFKFSQTTQCDTGEFGEITLSEPKHFPPGADFFSDFLVQHRTYALQKCIAMRIQRF